MNAGKPIAAMMNGEGPAVIDEAGCGWSVAAGDAKAFATLIRNLKDMDQEELTQIGEKGKAYCSEHFSFIRSVEKVEELMKR